jgi:hypothetical protein
MLGLGLYWWFPVVWWARRELRAVEEECCDAWVQWAFPDEVDGYARTLFRTIDFLSQDPAAMPAGASGMGHVSLLERRLRMILESRLHRRVSMPCRAALAAFAALVLPWTAGLTAREASPADEPGQAGEAQEPGGDPASPSGPAATGTDVPGEAAPGADLESQIEALQRQIEALNKQIQDLQGVGKARTRTPASNLPAGATGTAGRRPGKGAGRGVEGLPVTVGDRQCLVDVAGNVVTLWDPGKNAIRWQTKLDGDLSRAKISQDGKLLRVDRPGRTVTLDLATGKTVSDVALDPAAGKIASGGSRPPMAGALAGAGGQQGFKDPLTQHGAALGARGYAANDASWPAAAGPGIQPSGPPVDVVRLAEALIEAQGAAALARNKLERLAPAESAGVVSRTESSTLKVEIETAERKVDLLRRLARSALKGTHLEMERLREVEELANRRLKAGEASQEAVLAVQLRLANVETLADLLENILSETPAAKR